MLPSRASLRTRRDRKSTRLNSSHSQISYAVFCLKKKKNQATAIFLSNKNKRATGRQPHTSPSVLRRCPFPFFCGAEALDLPVCLLFFFFFNDTATTEIYTLSLHDALPI